MALFFIMFENKIKEIKNRLTGQKNLDISYLSSEIENSKENLEGVITALECSKLILNNLEEPNKERYKKKVLDFFTDNILFLFNESLNLFNRGRISQSQELIEYLIELIKYFNLEDYYSIQEYKEFDNPLELAFYIKNLKNTSSQIKTLPIPLGEIFSLYSNILNTSFRKEDYKIAKNFIKKALEYSPYTGKYYIELAKIYFKLQQFDKSVKVVLKALKFVTNNKDLASCYEILGDIFNEIKYFQQALMLYRLSLDFDPKNIFVLNKIDNLYLIDDTLYSFNLNYEDLKNFLKSKNIQLGINQDLITLCYSFAQNKLKNGDYKAAHYFATKGYELTELNSFKEILSILKNLE